MTDAGLVSGVSHSLRISIWRSLTLLMHCLIDSSLHTSSGSNIKVFPYASPAASTSLFFFFRSRMVAITNRERRHKWKRKMLFYLYDVASNFKLQRGHTYYKKWLIRLEPRTAMACLGMQRTQIISRPIVFI